LKKKISLNLASRVQHLPPYLFASIDRMKQKAIEKGIDLIDLSIGDPDLPTPSLIVEAMKKAKKVAYQPPDDSSVYLDRAG